jgi:hypothetical protein
MNYATPIISSCHIKASADGIPSRRRKQNSLSIVKNCIVGHLNTRCFSSPYKACWHIAQILFCLDARSQHPVSLGSLWQPILKCRKRCTQRMECGRSRNVLAWAASRHSKPHVVYALTCLPGRAGPGANPQNIPDSIPELSQVGAQDLEVNVVYGTSSSIQIILSSLVGIGHTRPS